MQSEGVAKKRTTAVFLIIAAAVAVRLYNINSPMFEFNPLRQAVNGFITRHLAFDPSASFLVPQIDNMGPAPAYFMCELPVVQYLTAQLVRVFGEHNWVFRILQVVFFTLSAGYFYIVSLKLFKYRVALLALLLYCLSPMSILMSRVFQIDMLMMFAVFFSMYHFLKWIEEEKTADLLWSNAGLLVFTLQKLPNFYIVLLFFVLFFAYRKPRLIFRFAGPFVCVAAINIWWWFIFSGLIRNSHPNEYTFVQGTSIFSITHMLYIMRQYITSPAYWVITFKQCFLQVLSPVIFLLSCIGLFCVPPGKARVTLWWWLVSVVLFLTFVPGAGLQDYYKLHLVPVSALFGALGYLFLFDKLKSRHGKNLFILFFWIAICAGVFAMVYPYIRYKSIFQRQEVLGRKLAHLSRHDDPVIASFGPDAMLLFYCHRKGWNQYLSGAKGNIELLEQRRAQGARFFVSGNLDEFELDKDFKEHMLTHYLLVESSKREFALPKKYSFDYWLWIFSGRRKEFERVSLGYVIFDLKGMQ